jgi:hypothetical protein
MGSRMKQHINIPRSQLIQVARNKDLICHRVPIADHFRFKGTCIPDLFHIKKSFLAIRSNSEEHQERCGK